MKKEILIFFTLGLLFLLLAYSKTISVYFRFKNLGADVVRIGYFSDEYLSAEVNIVKDGKMYNIVFRRIKVADFFNSSDIFIESINGYGILRYSCLHSTESNIIYIGDGWSGPIAFVGVINLIIIEQKGLFFELFEVEESSITWIINNIDKMEKKFMQIPEDQFSYHRYGAGSEAYYKRQKFTEEFRMHYRRQMRSAVEMNPEQFIFKNPECKSKF